MATERADPSHFTVEHYEGLVFATARRYERYVELEFEDFTQLLRIKVWRALEAYDPARSAMTVKRYVFQCVANQVKDVLKKKRRGEVHLEDVAGVRTGDGKLDADSTRFAANFLSISEEEAFREVEEVEVNLPETLTTDEHRVAVMLIEDFTQPDIAAAMEIRLGLVRAMVASIKLKMAANSPDLARFIEAPELEMAA